MSSLLLPSRWGPVEEEGRTGRRGSVEGGSRVGMREGVFRDGGRATTTGRAEDGGGFARVARWGRTLIFTIFVDGTSRRGTSSAREVLRARV